MEVAAGDRHQAEPGRPIAEPPPQTAGNPGTLHLDGPHARVNQLSERLQAEVERRMGQTGDAPRAADQPDRLEDLQHGLGHARGPAVAQEAGEDLADAGDLPGPRQVLGDVPPAQDRAREGSPQFVQIDRQPLVTQPLGHRPQPDRPALAEPSQRDPQAVVILPKEIAEEVELAAVQVAAQLDAGDQLHAQPVGLGPGDRQGRDRVMVGDRHRREPHRGGGVHHLAGRTDPVRVSRVHVQVGPGGDAAPVGSRES